MSEDPANTPAPDESKTGMAWGDDITEGYQSDLDAVLATWDAESDHGDRKGPFDVRGLGKLTGAGVYYLAKKHGWDLSRAVINLNLQGANLGALQLQEAQLGEAQLQESNLRFADLQGADLGSAQLQGADLRGAQLQRANLRKAQLQGADLSGAQLQNANLIDAHMEGADLASARLDRETRLNGAKVPGVTLDQIVFDNTNLTVVSWEGVAPLGDEKRARMAKGRPKDYHSILTKDRRQRIEEYEAAVRANRLLATALRAQGLTEDADVFAYRAQLMQRGLGFQRRQFGRWLVSWGLAALSGYGYRLGRIFAAYAIVVMTFAALFLLPIILTGAVPTIQQGADALQISLNAIHGRVFFVQFGLDTLQSWLATAESVIGIVIEGVFVAMIIQRLFR
jgi:hypothetical protein